jgi:hypothetical protein
LLPFTFAIEPPAFLRPFWNEGIIRYSREYGFELHTAALAMVEDRSAINARIWRGQAALILPRLDWPRYRLCDHLTQKYGRDWPVRWCTPDSSEEHDDVKTTPHACQWGYLRHLLSTVPQLRGENRFLSLAIAACKLRNNLTHWRPVSFSEFETFCRETDDLFPPSDFF